MSILDSKVHARLIADLDSIAAKARIPVHYIHTSCKDYLSADEKAWFAHLHGHVEHDVYGLVLSTKPNGHPVEVKLFAMCGWLLRNFIDARVITMDALIGEDEPPDPTVLLVPNFYTPSSGNPFAGWQLQKLHSYLFGRMSQGRLSVICVEDFKMVEKCYGKAIHQLLESHYHFIN